jgi:hypothetical protein
MKVNDLDQVEAQQMGIKMEKGALITPDDALNQGNGRVLTTQVGKFDKVEKLHIDPPAPTLLQMEEMLKDIAQYISGVTPEMMGQEIDDKAGIITMIRQSASITRLQPFYDSFDEFQRLDGDLTIEMAQQNYTYGKVQQIIGEQPTEEFDNKLFFKYGCKVAQGVLTESQQQLEAQQLIYAREALGIPVSSKRILNAMVLQNKDELFKEIEETEQQQQQMAQQKAQLEMQQMQVDNETKLSYARSQDGLAKERTAKIQTDVAVAHEKIRRSKEEESAAILNFVKAVKEIQTMDIDQILKSAQVIEALKPEIDEPTAKQEAI